MCDVSREVVDIPSVHQKLPLILFDFVWFGLVFGFQGLWRRIWGVGIVEAAVGLRVWVFGLGGLRFRFSFLLFRVSRLGLGTSIGGR